MSFSSISNKNSLFNLLESAESISLEEVHDTERQDARRFLLTIENPTSTDTQPKKKQQYSRAYLLESAKLLLENQDYLLARNIYSKLLQDNLHDAVPLKGLGICLFYLGERGSARKCFNALWELHEQTDALVWLGQCYAKEGDDGQAIQTFSSVEELSKLSKNEQFLYFKELGNCHFRQGSESSARDAYNRAQELQPNSEAVQVNLGMLEYHANRLEAAQDHFDKALEINPRSSRAHCGLGLIFIRTEDRFAAEKHLYKSIELDTQNETALLQLVLLAHRSEEFSSVTKKLQVFLKNDPDNIEINYAYASVLFKCGQWGTCGEHLDRVLKKDPYHRPAQNLKRDLTRNRHPN